MGRLRTAAFIAGALLASAAFGHEFVCEKTVDGEQVREIDEYPATLHFTVTVKNVHPTDASTAQAVHDPMLDALGVSFEPEAPFTLAVGQSASFGWDVTVKSAAHCRRLMAAPACGGSVDGIFQVDWESGAAQCRAQVVCAPDGASATCEDGYRHGLGFWKAHEKLVAACAAAGPIDLGLATVSRAEELEGILWGSPAAFADGSSRSKLDRLRFILARQLLVAACDVRVLGAQWTSSGQPAAAAAVIRGNACRDLEKLNVALRGDSDCAEGSTVDPGTATPEHAKSIAVDPSAASAGTCSDENGAGQ